MSNWVFSKAIDENETYKINGENIWNHHWHCTDKKVAVVGPYEGQLYYFKEYEIDSSGKKIRFVAGEFLNGKVGIYLKDE